MRTLAAGQRGGRRVYMAGFVVCAAMVTLPAAGQVAFSNAVSMGTVSVPGLVEASGVVASRNNADVLWTHNDHGDSARIFAIDTHGRYLGTYILPGAVNTDYEDIALGPGPLPEVQYLYVGDIGDNKSKRGSIEVYRIPEPAVYARQAAAPSTFYLKGLTGITMTYPDGAHNAEALLVDPLSGDLFVVTMESSVGRIYRATRSQLASGGTVALTAAGRVAFDVANGGDISPSGREIVLRQEDFARLWLRSPTQSVAEALQLSPVAIPVVGRPTEPNGEAIGFDRFGHGYFTLSDSCATQPLYYFGAASASAAEPSPAVVAAGTTWRYLDTGIDPGSSWNMPAYDDSSWRSGDGPLGYGSGDEQTIVAFGSDPNAKFITTYFRKAFVVAEGPATCCVNLKLVFNDGAAVYLNGTPIARVNLDGAADYLTTASGPRDSLLDTWTTLPIDPVLLSVGTNTLAVELHVSDPARTVLRFDAQLEVVATTPTCITSIHPRPDGHVQLRLQSEATTVIVEESTNWVDWRDVASIVLTNNAATFTTTAAPAVAFRLFRLRTP